MLVPGVIGSAVVAATRCSAGLTRAGLARSLGVKPATVRGWENGEAPLYGVPYTELRRVALALGRTDDLPSAVLNYLLMAAQWDLLVSELLADLADYAELPPIGSDTEQGVVTRDLLAWGFHGIVPDCYREFARPGFLYGASDRLRIAGMLDELRLSTNSELVEYSTVLLALISPDGELVDSADRRGLRRFGPAGGVVVSPRSQVMVAWIASPYWGGGYLPRVGWEHAGAALGDYIAGGGFFVGQLVGIRPAHRSPGEWRCWVVAEDPAEQVADAAMPGGVHPAGVPLPRAGCVGRIDLVGQVEAGQAPLGVVQDGADVVVGAGVVVSGADEAAALVVVERDFVASADQPGEDAAGLG